MMRRKGYVIPDDEKMEVAVYARVSTTHESQLYSFERQLEYIKDLLMDFPNWEPVWYCDKGLSGTSANKRKEFQKLIEDVKKKKYKIVITREVSRLARNTLLSLNTVNDLKGYGVEFWFPEDDLWSTDPDFDIKFQEKCVQAQAYSKEQSRKSKMGLKESHKQGMLPGSGNILGYDRIGKRYVVNPEQAETVKMIFKWCLEGKSLRDIKDELERLGRKTATGKSNWHEKTISQILHNRTYTGTIVYNKQYSNNYLEQKRIMNQGEVPQDQHQGDFEPLVSMEDFEEVQRILEEKTNHNDGRKNGRRESDSIWSKKLICKCGHRFNHIKWGKKSDGTKKYGFICNLFAREGSVENREARNVDPSATCTVRSFPEEKLWMMVESILMSLQLDRQKLMDFVCELIDKSVYSNHKETVLKEIKQTEQNIEVFESRLKSLLNYKADAKDAILIAYYESTINDCMAKIKEAKDKEAELSNIDFAAEEEHISERIAQMKDKVNHLFDLEKHVIPETIIDAVVCKVKVYENNKFEFFIRVSENENIVYECEASGKKKYNIVISNAYRNRNSDEL